MTERRTGDTLDITTHCPLATALARRLREERLELTRRWLDRIASRVSLDPNRVFPTEELLNHVPLLLSGVADYLENPAHVIGADTPVIGKAMELGALRLAQGFDEYELLKEYEILGGILYSFLVNVVDGLDEECSRAELLVCGHRLFRAIALIQQASLTHYLRLMKERLKEREERLRGFNRALTHELKNQIGAALGAAEILDIEGIPEEQRKRLIGVIGRNVGSMKGVLDNLVELSRLDVNTRSQRYIRLPQAVAEVVRELRDHARKFGVDVRVRELPPIEVPAAAVELALTNFVSNAVKYSDPSQGERWVEIRGRFVDSEDSVPCELVVEVCDNGLGVPAEKRHRLFERFFRAHETITGVEGTGLGLSIVRDALSSVGGRAWAEFPERGSLFAFSLPCRREAERAELRAMGLGNRTIPGPRAPSLGA